MRFAFVPDFAVCRNRVFRNREGNFYFDVLHPGKFCAFLGTTPAPPQEGNNSPPVEGCPIGRGGFTPTDVHFLNGYSIVMTMQQNNIADKSRERSATE